MGILTTLNGYKPGLAAASRFGYSNICPGSTWLFSLGPFLEMFLSDSLFLGGGITGRGGSSSMSGSSLRLIPNTSKGSGDPKPNLIRIINFVCFQRFCSFSKRMRTFSCTHIPHTHTKNGCALFPNIPAVFCGGCAILCKTCIICDVQEIFTKDYYFN